MNRYGPYHDVDDDSPDGRFVTVSRRADVGVREVNLHVPGGGCVFADATKLRDLAAAVAAAADWLELHWDDDEDGPA